MHRAGVANKNLLYSKGYNFTLFSKRKNKQTTVSAVDICFQAMLIEKDKETNPKLMNVCENRSNAIHVK